MGPYRKSRSIAAVFVLGLAVAPLPVMAQGVPQRLATLEAAVAALQAQVATLEGQLITSNGTITALQAALSAEQSGRSSADAGLQSQIATLQAALDGQQSTAYWSLVENFIPLTTQLATVATLNLPAGSYVVSARVGLSGFTVAETHVPTGTCRLVADGTLDSADITVTTPSIAPGPTISGLTLPLSLQGAIVSTTATTVTLKCFKHSALDTVIAVIPALMGVSVGQVIVSFP